LLTTGFLRAKHVLFFPDTTETWQVDPLRYFSPPPVDALPVLLVCRRVQTQAVREDGEGAGAGE